jgi:hypothetical protein
MAKQPKDATNQIGKPQSEYAKNYGTYRPGDGWFNEEQNVMDNRKTTQTPGGKLYDGSGRARQMQQKDLDEKMADSVAGGKIPSYKKGGKIRKTGLAKVHKGERMIPKNKVKGVEKAMRNLKRG